MITRTAPSWHTQDWQNALSDSIRSVESLWQRLNLPNERMSDGVLAHRDFSVRVTEHYLSKIELGDIDDPLLKQIMPVFDEMVDTPGFVADPLEERSSNQQSGLLHKYQSRVLLVLSGTCAINCRYCFRRHFPYRENRLGREQIQHIKVYLEQHPEVNEVILSGGDPLITSNQRLASLLSMLESVSTVRRLRIHSRLPVVLPQRIDDELLVLLESTSLQTVLVTHSNHPQELDGLFDLAMKQLQRAGVTLLNQAVLLRGVNDRADVLVHLSERLFEAGVLPYYLHLLDPVAGAHHFDVPEIEAKTLVKSMQLELAGFLLPRLVKEEAGKSSKTLIDLHLS